MFYSHTAYLQQIQFVIYYYGVLISIPDIENKVPQSEAIVPLEIITYQYEPTLVDILHHSSGLFDVWKVCSGIRFLLQTPISMFYATTSFSQCI